ncbi:hypothetical protein O9929_00985 [Vibrio lentus]|nr:hypothetical protein [Vibrio lentus]
MRLVVQAVLSICMMYFADIRLENIGVTSLEPRTAL